MKCAVVKFSLRFPHDAESLGLTLAEQGINPSSVLAIISKTDGNGELNDYSRQIAEHAFADFLASQLGVSAEEVRERVAFIASAGSEGLVALHGYVIYAPEHSACVPGVKGLVAGMAKTRPLHLSEIGGIEQVHLVAEATRQALSEAAIDDPSDVGVVFVKAPVLRRSDCRGAAPGRPTVEPGRSISLTRAASALGVAIALGEVAKSEITPEMIGRNEEIYSRVAFTFSGNEVSECRIIVLGNSLHGNPDLFIASRNLQDLLDISSVWALLRQAGLDEPGLPPKRLVALFAKFGADREGRLRNKKTALRYSDLNVGRQLRAAASGMLAPLLGDPEVFISGGAEHQGPPGGGLIVAVIRRADERYAAP